MYPNYPNATYVFRIYIAGGTPNSGWALARLYAICQKHFPKNHRILIVDVLKEPIRALADEIMVTPTIVKVSPSPEMKIIGNLGDEKLVLQALGLTQNQTHENDPLVLSRRNPGVKRRKLSPQPRDSAETTDTRSENGRLRLGT